MTMFNLNGTLDQQLSHTIYNVYNNAKITRRMCFVFLQRDCLGHGTMVASVAATTNGIARNASIGAYRVFGCNRNGVATDAVIIPAIDRAVRDGCHIINLSLSSYSGYADGVRHSTARESHI